jgi:Phosphotransferase enzyme family
VTAADVNPQALADHASALIGWRVRSALPVRRGGNNRVYQLVGDGQRALLKFYDTAEAGRQDRLVQEYAALEFLSGLGFAEVARPLAVDRARSCAVYEWIDGVTPGPAGEADIDQMADFFARLQTVRDRQGASAIGPASAGCFSPKMVADQVKDRLSRLATAISSGTAVAAFVAGSLTPAADDAVERLRIGCSNAGIAFAERLRPEALALSPSDFGLHNALRRADGRLAFVDFEYFGWDDPAKAIADVMLHPGMSLTEELAHRYRARVEQALQASDPMLPLRLDLFFPAMVVLWCLILLNEFLPERWARRKLAGVSDEREIVQARQLHKAQQLLARRFS